MTASDKVLIARDGAVTTITFNQPERKNAVDVEAMALFRDRVEEAASDSGRVVVVTGAGADFCSGADLKAGLSADQDVTGYLRTYTNRAILALRSSPKPVIAKVRGAAVGVGCNYALACDLRVAAEDARFGQIFARIGLMPDGGSTYFLPRMIGYARAFEWMALAGIYDARQCLEIGLVNRVVPAAELDQAVDELARRLAAGPAVAYAQIKRALAAGETGTLAESLEAEATGQKACFASADFAEGVRAFLEKRPPKFEGR